MTESLICRSPFPYTASQLFALFADEKDVAFLDSSLVNDLGCYSLIGLVPYHTVSVAQGQLQVDGKSHEGTAETYLKAYLKKHYQANRTSLPLTAGAIGYVSYDYGLALHGMKSRHTPAFPLPDMKWVFYDFFIIEHRQSHTVWFAANGQTMPAEALLAQMEEKIRTRLQERPSSRTSENPQYALAVQADSTPESYRKALQKLRDYLFAGDVYVTNFTSTLTVRAAARRTPSSPVCAGTIRPLSGLIYNTALIKSSVLPWNGCCACAMTRLKRVPSRARGAAARRLLKIKNCGRNSLNRKRTRVNC